MALILPQLPGLAFPVDLDAGMFDTSTETSVSGKDTRYLNRIQARYRRTLSIEGLDASRAFPNLTANSLQTLRGFFNQCYGGALMFLYWDPEDNSASAQQFGVGDGTTKTFQLARASGGWVDNVFAPFAASAPTLIPSASQPNNAAANVYAPMNLFANGNALASGLTLTDMTLTGAAADPFGGTLAALLTETTATGFHDASQSGIPIPAGAPLIGSVYLQAGGARYAEIILDNGADGAVGCFDLQNGVLASSYHQNLSTTPVYSITAAGAGWFRCSVGGYSFPTTSCRFAVVSNNNSATAGWYLSYAGSASNTFSAAFPQVEISSAGAPSPYNPTLATLYYGSPAITVGGAYVDPSTYALNAANGQVTFAAPPASGAALEWSGNFYWPCNWDDDKLSLSQFMSGLWEAKKLSFTTRVF